MEEAKGKREMKEGKGKREDEKGREGKGKNGRAERVWKIKEKTEKKGKRRQENKE